MKTKEAYQDSNGNWTPEARTVLSRNDFKSYFEQSFKVIEGKPKRLIHPEEQE